MNFDLIIKKIMSRKGFGDEKEVAKLFGLSAPDLSNRKKRGSLLPFVIKWALHENVNLDWLIKGETEIQPVPVIVSEKPEDFQPEHTASSLQPLLGLPLIIDEPELSIHPQYTNAVHKLFNDMSAAERKIKRLSAKLERIVNEGDHKKIKLLETQLEFLDPGVKNQNVVNEQNG